MNYGTDVTTLTVSCGSASETIELTAEAQDYTLTLVMNEAAADQQVTIASSGSKQRFYLYSVDIYNGGLVKAVSETGNENSRVITGITDKHYVVEGLTAGETYEYYVIANYVDGTSRMSNIEQVTLLEDQGHGYQVGDVNHDGDVDIADVTALIDMLLNGGASGCPICGDVNPDGEVNIADVTSLVDSLLGGN